MASVQPDSSVGKVSVMPERPTRIQLVLAETSPPDPHILNVAPTAGKGSADDSAPSSLSTIGPPRIPRAWVVTKCVDHVVFHGISLVVLYGGRGCADTDWQRLAM